MPARSALAILERIGNHNRKGEFYLTDAVEIARGMKLRAVAVEVEEDDVRGINTKGQLAEAEAVAQQRLRQAALDAGVTLVAPETVFLCADTKFGKDVVVEPYVVFGEKVTVEDGAVIHSFSHLAGAHVGKGVSVGPFARLRPGTRLGEGVRIGNFVEVKEAVIEAGAKANHLSYIGDAFVGAERQYRRRHHHLQLRRQRQASHRDRQGRLHRLELGAGRAGQDRRGRLCRLRVGDHRRRARRMRWRSGAAARPLRKAGRRACAD